LVRDVVRPLLHGLDNVVLTDSLDYHEFAHVLAAAHVVLTDSGGVQEEAPSLGKPVLVLRDTTERPEAVDAGTVRLVGTTTDRVGDALRTLFGDEVAHERMATAVNPYGDGLASRRAVAATAALLGCGTREPDFQAPRTGALVGL
jgi:UDP-N-acetylglucosamine 2-epimerase (non-hydrolysing)